VVGSPSGVGRLGYRCPETLDEAPEEHPLERTPILARDDVQHEIHQLPVGPIGGEDGGRHGGSRRRHGFQRVVWIEANRHSRRRVVQELVVPLLSFLEHWDFDAALIVMFDERLEVRRAAWLTAAEVEAAARDDPYVSASRVIASDSFMERGTDWTERLREAARHQDD
jgi:hypothetical protein